MRCALVLAGRGMKVFPLQPGSKVPAVRRDWEGCASSEIEQIERWWAHVPYNVAVATGPSHLLVVDLDAPKPNALDARHGRQVFADLAQQLGVDLPRDTLTVATAGNGLHLYLRSPADVHLTNTAGRLGPGIDTRAGGGYVVAPGSRVGGRPYRVLCSLPPAPAPSWLLDQLRPRRVALPPVGARSTHGSYVRAALAGEVRNVEDAPISRRNHTLFVAAARLARFVGSGQLSAHDVRVALVAAADRHVGVEGFSQGEALRTVDSGLRRAAAVPRDRQSPAAGAATPRR